MRAPAPLLAGSLLLASVLLSAGIWSWSALKSAPRLGTWTETGTVIQWITDSTIYIGSGPSAAEYTLDPSEFDSSPTIEAGDWVKFWVASIPETLYSPFWGTAEGADWRIIKVQSQRGTWTARDYSYRAAAARAAAQPGFGLNLQTVRWVGSIAGALVAVFVVVGLQARLAPGPSPKGSPRVNERPLPDATAARFSGSDRSVLGCSLALALAVLAATVLLSWWLFAR